MPDDLPAADGVVEKGPDGSTRIRFVRRLPHPVERVWEALTDPAELRKWWGDADLDLVDGGRFALRWRNTDEDGNAATLDGAITKLDPPRFLQISATWGSTANNAPATLTTLTWELDPEGGHTLLRFTNTISAPGPGDADSPSPPPPPAGTCTSTPSPPSSPVPRSTSPTPNPSSSRSTRPTPRSTAPHRSERTELLRPVRGMW